MEKMQHRGMCSEIIKKETRKLEMKGFFLVKLNSLNQLKFSLNLFH